MIEHTSIDENLDWKKADVIAAGIDIGAVSSKAVILLDGRPYAFSKVKTRVPKTASARTLDAIFAKTDLKLKNIHNVVATGCGRQQVLFARKTLSDIACSALGAVHIWGPSVRTVLDAGGQNCRVIHCTEKGRIVDFLWSDKCAAGIGRSLETFAGLVRKDITEIGNIAIRCDRFPRLSDFCSVYAQSEALDLLKSNVPVEQIISAYHSAMAKRMSTLVDRCGLKSDFVVIGGLSMNPGIMHGLEGFLKVKSLAPKPEWHPALATALGAALFADGFCRRQKLDHLAKSHQTDVCEGVKS